MLSQRHLTVKKSSKAFWHNADTSVVSFLAAIQGEHAGLAAALLQALRWRLEKAISATDRCQVLSGYIQRDILLLRSVLLTSLSLGLEFAALDRRLSLSAKLVSCCLCCLECVWLVLSLVFTTMTVS